MMIIAIKCGDKFLRYVVETQALRLFGADDNEEGWTILTIKRAETAILLPHNR